MRLNNTTFFGFFLLYHIPEPTASAVSESSENLHKSALFITQFSPSFAAACFTGKQPPSSASRQAK